MDSDPTGANDGLADSPTLGFSVNNLGQGIDLNGSQYLDLTAHTVELKDAAVNLAALDRGTFSIWLKPGKDPVTNQYEESTILSGSNVTKTIPITVFSSGRTVPCVNKYTTMGENCAI